MVRQRWSSQKPTKNPSDLWCIFGKNEQIGSIFSPKLTLCWAESTNLVLLQETRQGEFLVGFRRVFGCSIHQ